VRVQPRSALRHFEKSHLCGRGYSPRAHLLRATWTQVQERLAENVQGERRARAASPSPLAGLIVDEAGEPLVPVHACKGKVRYRYYISRALQHHGANKFKTGIRLPARDIELLVAEQVANFFEDPTSLAASACVTITGERIREINDRCTAIVADLRKGSSARLAELVSRVLVRADQIEIVLTTSAVANALASAIEESAVPMFAITAAARLTRTGRAMRLVQPSGSVAASTHADPTLVKLLLKARRWWSVLLDGRLTVTTLAHEMGVTPAYLTRVVRLAFLAPIVVESILEGRQRSTANGAALTATEAISDLWQVQMSRFLSGNH
jgi:site-specific DNA recombinase